MIWYLLYPFRGTTEAPVLAPSHPLRRTFAKYGACVARHVITTLLISTAVAAILIYPIPFLYSTDFANGASNLPHHVWTLAQPLEGGGSIEPDVIMRSVWIHGSYMKALDRDVLLGALELQDELLGPTENFSPRSLRGAPLVSDEGGLTDLTPIDRDSFHIINGLTNQSWFFHSPLLYWSCAADSIGGDLDIISTVNQRKNQPTSVNVTLRHSIVFSGKRFEDRRLLAADALVITLVHLRDSPVGRQWARKAEELASGMADKWTAYPADGRTMSSQLYEFQFRPISLQDGVMLALAYCLSLSYFFTSMSKLRAVKSKFGLVVTVMTQIFLSILSSFTVCAVFKIDLSKIPQAAFPLVVLSMSLENVFRLINAVIVTPSEDSTSSRIGYAFGDTAHVALASTAQNVLILWGLCKVVSPGVSAFCTFAAVAIVFDFFYLSTFFLSVLSVDVRRTELIEALDKASSRNTRQSSESLTSASWTEALLQGNVAMSTRIAGTIIMVGFVLIAQWHFFENETILRVLGRLFNISRKNGSFAQQKESLLVDIHQARSPTSWLRLQDHDTAREVINVVKPWAHSYVAKVYDPLVLVLNGADRTPHEPERPFSPALYDFIDHHMTKFVVTVVFLLAVIRLLMNFLLWGEESESNSDGDSDDEPLMSVKALEDGHLLDVALVSASVDGHIVSVGLDRSIRVWDVRSGIEGYALADVASALEDPFPILSLAIDHTCTWLGLLSLNKAHLFNLVDKRWGRTMPIDLGGQKPQAFFFDHTGFREPPELMVVVRNGVMIRLVECAQDATRFVICQSPLVSAETFASTNPQTYSPDLSILTASRKGCIHVASRVGSHWSSLGLDIHTGDDRDASQVVALSVLDCFLIARQKTVDLVDGKTNRLIYTFQTSTIQPRSLRCFHSARRKPQCGSIGLVSFGLAYNDAETDECVIQTYSPREEGDTICFRNTKIPASKTCCEWTDAKVSERRLRNPGTWEALPNGYVVGVRRVRTSPAPISPPLETSATSSLPSLAGKYSGLRRRIYSLARDSESRRKLGNHAPEDDWEVWIAYRSGKQDLFETGPLCTPSEAGGAHHQRLFITELGPMVKVGTASVVVGFGNVLKLVTVGHERFEDGVRSGVGGTDEPWNVGSRRRKFVRRPSRSRIMN